MSKGHLNKMRKASPDQAFTVVASDRDLPNDILVIFAVVLIMERLTDCQRARLQ